MNYYNNTDYTDYKEATARKIHIRRLPSEKSIKSI